MTAANRMDALRGIHPLPRLDGKPILDLADGWTLAADINQWIVCRRRFRHGKPNWQPRSFVGSNKSVLRRDLRKQGIEVRPESNGAAHAFLSLPPHNFLDWRLQILAGRR